MWYILNLLYENIDDFFDYFDEVKDSEAELQKSKNVFSRTLQKENVYFDVIVFDLDETLIETSSHSKGQYSVTWNATRFTSGLYFVRMLVNDEYNYTKKVLLVK